MYTPGNCRGNRRRDDRRDSRPVYTLQAIVAAIVAATIAATNALTGCGDDRPVYTPYNGKTHDPMIQNNGILNRIRLGQIIITDCFQ